VSFRYTARTERRGLGKVVVVLAIVLVVLAIAGTVMARTYYHQNLKPVSQSQQNQLITIETGSTAHDIALLLKERGLIRSTWAFEWYVRSHNLRDRLQAGSYYLRPNQDVQTIATALTNGKVATDLVTILPAQRLSQVRQAFINAGFKAADVDAALEPGQYENLPVLASKPKGANLEGYLYPESFQKTANTKPQTVIRQSLELMQKNLTADIQASFVAQGLTVHQGVTIASIVEQEVSKLSDRPIVAQVFLKRFKIGMPLGADPTAFYGAIIAGAEPSVAYDSPYNTRIHKGLPPGPIGNVSATSLKAVAHPANTDYLFFVAGDDGTTYFSHTEEQHRALTKAHCTKLCQ
jgi:UPF0755 protein